MATGTAPLTQLEAVNLMLQAVFEAPVNTLDSSGIEDVAIAQRMLSAKVREVLLRGLAMNREVNVTLTRDGSNQIPLPNNVLRVDAMDTDGADVVQRGLYLYDRTNHTLVFTRDVVCEVYYHIEWDDLPEHVKYPIAVLAARRFQKHVLGDSAKGGYDKDDETEAKVILEEADVDTDDPNMNTDSWSVAEILCR